MRRNSYDNTLQLPSSPAGVIIFFSPAKKGLHMRALLMFSALAVFCFVSAGSALPMTSVRGTVSHRISGCDYFLVLTPTGYDVLEWYGDHDPDKGDVLIDNYETYGFHDILDETADEKIHVYTDDYHLSKTSALEKLTDKCE